MRLQGLGIYGYSEKEGHTGLTTNCKGKKEQEVRRITDFRTGFLDDWSTTRKTISKLAVSKTRNLIAMTEKVFKGKEQRTEKLKGRLPSIAGSPN